MTRRRRDVCVLLTLALLAPAGVGAQSPWEVTITPSLNPQPIGLCGAVYLTIKDAVTHTAPRRPNGALITMADFDMSVSAIDAKAVVGEFNTASNFAVCGCQVATPGTIATVTATYPAKALAADMRVPGVTFQATANVSLGRVIGTANPPACNVVASSTAVRGGTAPPLASPPLGTPSATAAPPPLPAPPAAPVLVKIVPTPSVAKVIWKRVPGATSYTVERWKPDAPTCCKNDVKQLTDTTWVDQGGFPVAGNYEYKVSAVNAGGSSTPAIGSFVRPAPKNPQVWADKLGLKTRLNWDPVFNATYYLVWGPGLPSDGQRVNESRPPCLTPSLNAINTVCSYLPPAGSTPQQQLQWMQAQTHKVVLPVEPGPRTYTIGAFYSPGPVSTPATEFTSITVDQPAAAVPDASSRFRISVLGFDVRRETSDDDAFKNDGRHDEIYLAAVVCTTVRPAPPKCNELRRSKVHGDVMNFPGRVQAGSASPQGGIVSGDYVGIRTSDAFTAGAPGSFPFVLWEGTLESGKEQIWIAPSLWESDGSDTQMMLWSTRVGTWVLQRFQGVAANPAERCGQITGMGNDRPIGSPMNPVPGLPCTVFGVTRESMQQVLSDAKRVGGTTYMPRMELYDAVDEGAAYVMYLRFERIPMVSTGVVK